MSDKPCEHIEALEAIKPSAAYECVECVKVASTWVHLRTCQSCGLTHCCDSSPLKHATAHFKSSSHPVMASAEPGERWLWCYVDEEMVGY